MRVLLVMGKHPRAHTCREEEGRQGGKELALLPRQPPEGPPPVDLVPQARRRCSASARRARRGRDPRALTVRETRSLVRSRRQRMRDESALALDLLPGGAVPLQRLSWRLFLVWRQPPCVRCTGKDLSTRWPTINCSSPRTILHW